MQPVRSDLFVFIRQSCASKFPASFLGAVIVFFCLFNNAPNLAAAAGNNGFPVFPVIQSNVAFWEKIYTTYSTSEAVIHDLHDLTKIYEVVPIMDYQLPGAQQANKPVLKTAEQKYTAILSRLAKGISPVTKEEHRIFAMYKGVGKSQLLKASESVRIQIGQKERFKEGVIRSGAYLAEIKRIFRSYGLPEELAYLPHVESSFNTNAYSKAGASGLWQFTPSTGKQYLRIDHTIDERQDPYLASHAAAKFLKRNYSVLGSWPLALTAYNYGTSGMARAKKDKGSYEKIFLEYQEGHFKFASRNFYSEFLAALHAAKKMEQDSSLHRHKPAPIITVRLTNRASIETISRHFKVDVKTIKTLNPAIKPAVFEGKKQLPQGYQLTLPATVKHDKKQAILIKTSRNLWGNHIFS